MEAARRINLDKDNRNSNGLLEQGEALQQLRSMPHLLTR